MGIIGVTVGLAVGWFGGDATAYSDGFDAGRTYAWSHCAGGYQ